VQENQLTRRDGYNLRCASVVLAIVFLICLSATISGQIGNEATGRWSVRDVAYAPWTLTLHADGSKLTGTVSQARTDPTRGRSTSLTAPVEIYDGTIDGNIISFKCKSPDGDRIIIFTGELNGDEIAFTRSVQVRAGGDPGEDGIYGATGAASFTARRDAVIAELRTSRSPAQLPIDSQPAQVEMPNVRPLARSTVMPVYPEESRRKRVQGPAVVEFVIGTDGRLSSKPQIVVAPDQAIGDAVIDAVSQWTFNRLVRGQPPRLVKVLGDLTFYFVLDNDKALVLNPRDLPPGKTFPTFPSSFREKQMLDERQVEQQQALQRGLQPLLPPSSFPELPEAFRTLLDSRGCKIPEMRYRDGPRGVISREFAQRGQTDWAALCDKGGQSSILVFWGKNAECDSELATAGDIQYIEGDGGRAILPTASEELLDQIKSDRDPTHEAGGGNWIGSPAPDYPNLSHSAITDYGRKLQSDSWYCSQDHWYDYRAFGE